MIIFWLLLIFIVFTVLTSLLRRKFQSNYTNTFIFGKKGAGKSCLMVHEMIKYLRRGWNVYTDIQDVNIPGVRIIDSSGLKNFVPVADSLLCLDEVGITFDNRKFKTFDEGFRDFFKLQRKYRVKVIMNSQSYDIDSKIRAVVDNMILQTNLLGCISVSRPIVRKVCLTSAENGNESRIADQLKFAGLFSWRFYWMPSYFKYFDSFAAPHREPIAFRLNPGDPPPRQVLKMIQWRFNHRG